MTHLYTSRTSFDAQANSAPDYVVLDVRFRDLFGEAVAVDSDLRVELFNVGSGDVVQELTFNSTPAIQSIVRPQGTYYLVQVDPSLFTGPIEAKWYAKHDGKEWDPYPLVKRAASPTTAACRRKVWSPSAIRA